MWNVGLKGARQPRMKAVARALLKSVSVGRGKSEGFTLIEMMVVVAIIGVLATLAVVGYRKLTQSSHVSEATNMVQNIRVAQEGYHSETQMYANITNGFPSGSGATGSGILYPATPQYQILTGWGATCTWCLTDWSVLPLHVDGPVLFGYATLSAGIAGTNAKLPASLAVNGTAMAVAPPTVSDWYAVAAEADLDGIPSTVTNVFAFSWTNQMFVSNEGQ
jgi:type IV pilus assembly protein PilA